MSSFIVTLVWFCVAFIGKNYVNEFEYVCCLHSINFSNSGFLRLVSVASRDGCDSIVCEILLNTRKNIHFELLHVWIEMIKCHKMYSNSYIKNVK